MAEIFFKSLVFLIFVYFCLLTISLTGKVLPIVHEVMSIMKMIHSIIRIHTYILI